MLAEPNWDHIAQQTEGYSGSDLSTLVNDGLMRPIKEIQKATHFKKVCKVDLLEKGLITEEELKENWGSDEEGAKDHEGEANDYVWQPVCSDPKSEEYDANALQEEGVKEMELPEISDKRIFVRKASFHDFKRSIKNCKPTVNSNSLELYAWFLQKYGHEDQKDNAEQMVRCNHNNTYKNMYA